MKACTICGTANDNSAHYCSHCGATMDATTVSPPARPRRVVAGILTGVGVAIVYISIEAFLTVVDYRLVGRFCIGPILAIGWTLLVLSALVYSLMNRSISENLGASYVVASSVTALVLVALPVALCTSTNVGNVSQCRGLL